MTVDQLLTIYQKRLEEYHRSLKQNASLAKSPTRTPTTQTNHFVAALWTFTKLEMLKMRTKKNHYALKTQLYLSALQQAFESLCSWIQYVLTFQSMTYLTSRKGVKSFECNLLKSSDVVFQKLVFLKYKPTVHR